jgi:hypothetical protein
VELVPINPPVVPQPAHQRKGLNRRDFIVFGLGAGSVLLAILVGWITALIFRPASADEGNR